MRVATSGVADPCLNPPPPVRASVASPGLVPFKTKGQSELLSLAPSALAERRVARLRRAVWAAGHLQALADEGRPPSACWFVTLTYVGVDDWKAQHITLAVRRFRRWCMSQQIDCRYVWVAELQRRLAVHYHLLAWLPPGLQMPHWDLDRAGRTWWPHGMSNTERARAGVGYLMKYVSKLGSVDSFPKGLRLYGIGGLNAQARAVRGWFNLPEWAKREHGVGEVSRHSARLVAHDTGEILESPWAVKVIRTGLQLTLKRDMPPRFHDGAYSSWPRVSA